MLRRSSEFCRKKVSRLCKVKMLQEYLSTQCVPKEQHEELKATLSITRASLEEELRTQVTMCEREHKAVQKLKQELEEQKHCSIPNSQCIQEKETWKRQAAETLAKEFAEPQDVMRDAWKQAQNDHSEEVKALRRELQDALNHGPLAEEWKLQQHLKMKEIKLTAEHTSQQLTALQAQITELKTQLAKKEEREEVSVHQVAAMTLRYEVKMANAFKVLDHTACEKARLQLELDKVREEYRQLQVRNKEKEAHLSVVPSQLGDMESRLNSKEAELTAVLSGK
ncbi:uncharacterized protein LOC142489317 [Ascaphus truei]|uniref:uncharacterized protein LOC142489317 n=1 Tax=Ascaphus truei TaxID=8439 RepID=UPI003F5A47C8